MNASPDPQEPERERAVSHPDPALGENKRAFTPYTTPPSPRVDELPQRETTPQPKPQKRWLMPLIAAVCLLFAAGVGSMEFTSQSSSGPTSVRVQNSEQAVLTVCGADADKATTAQAVADLKAGVSNPLLAPLSDQEKQELLHGEREFYRIPVANPQANASEAATPPGNSDSGDRIQVNFNGTTYGVYNLEKQPVTLDMPLKIGDQVDVKCLSVAQGKSSLVVDMATVLNPVESHPLSPGESQTFHVRHGSAGQNYDWFQQQAKEGNPVAEYGLGHMFQYGIGEPQDNGQAVYWYRQAAAQNYLDAQTQLSRMGSQ